MNSLYGWILNIILSGVIAYGGYTYYTTTQEKLTAQAALIAESDIRIAELEGSLLEIEANMREQLEANKVLEVELRAATKNKNTLIKTLNKHNLTKLTAAKPGLIETRINEATKQVFEDLERTTSNPSTNNGM